MIGYILSEADDGHRISEQMLNSHSITDIAEVCVSNTQSYITLIEYEHSYMYIHVYILN